MKSSILLIALFVAGCNQTTEFTSSQATPQSVKSKHIAKQSTQKPQILQNSASIGTVAFSPGGGLLAAGVNGKIKIWDVKSARLKRALGTQNEGFGQSIAFSPNGKTVASAGTERFEAGHLTIWDIHTGKIIRSLTAHEDTGALFSIAFSPNGNLIAGGSENSKVVLWNARTEKIRTKNCPGSMGIVVNSLAFSPNGEILAAAGNNKIFLWNTTTGKLQHSITTWPDTPIGPVYFAFSKNGKVLAAQSGHYENQSSESYRGYIGLWSVRTGKLERKFQKHASWITSVCFSPDDKIIASGDDEGNIRLWEVQTGKLKRTLKGHRKGINSIAISPDGKLLASGSNDGTLKVWRLN
jgi:WD40 repeat protein